MSDELSDEAANIEFKKRFAAYSPKDPKGIDGAHDISFWGGWQECRRRALGMIENEIEHCAELRMDLESRISDLEALIETERRKAFEAGWEKRGNACYPNPQDWEIECGWDAYTEAAKEQK